MTRVEEWLAAHRARYETRFPVVWRTVMEGLGGAGRDRVWLFGAANYFLRAGGVRWGIDPVVKHPKLLEGIAAGEFAALREVAFFLLTHSHRDHLHLPTLQALAAYPARWVTPHFLEDAPAKAGIPARQVVLMRPGETVEIEGVRIHAFNGRHRDAGTNLGVEALWYLADTGKRRMLFPGDVRDFDTRLMPRPGRVDDLFAHVWLGRRNALNPCPEPFLTQFAGFVSEMDPARVFLAHLYELGRNPNDLWTYTHAGMVMDALAAARPEIRVVIPSPGVGEPL